MPQPTKPRTHIFVHEVPRNRWGTGTATTDVGHRVGWVALIFLQRGPKPKPGKEGRITKTCWRYKGNEREVKKVSRCASMAARFRFLLFFFFYTKLSREKERKKK